MEPLVALALLLAAAGYAVAVRAAWRRAGRDRGIRRREVLCFAAGLAVVAVALGPPLDGWSEELFSAHMAQHILLATVAPPLLMAAAPVAAVLWLLPPGWRRPIALTVGHSPVVQPLWRVLTAPAVAWLVHAAALWVWHLPRLYALALERPLVHAAQHLSFLGTGVLLWWPIVRPRGLRRQAFATGILLLFATLMQSGALGALLTLSSRVWYPVHGNGSVRHGMSPLEDQQLAGLLMWVVGGLFYVVLMSGLFVLWLRRDEGFGTADGRLGRFRPRAEAA